MQLQQPQVGGGGDLAARETFELRKSIEEFNKQASKQTQQMIFLTWAIAVLTLIMTGAVFFQIYLAIVQ